MKKMIEDHLFDIEFEPFLLPGEKDLIESEAWIFARFRLGDIDELVFIKALNNTVDAWKREANISCMSIEESIRMMRAATIRSAEIEDKLRAKRVVEVLKRKKKASV